MQPHRSSAVPLAWLYAALVAYASLYPASGWQWPSGGLLDWLTRQWTPWWTAFDLVANLLGYLPLGALMFAALLRSGRRALPAAATAALGAAALSFTLEFAQNFVPGRVPSNVDLALNSLGALLGVATGLAVHALGGIGRWQTLRERWFIDRSAGGIALLLLWPLALLFPTPVPLGVGQVLGEAQSLLHTWLSDTSAQDWAEEWLRAEPSFAPLSRTSEIAAVALGLLAPCMVALAVSRPGWRRVALVLGVVLAAVGATTLSTVLNFGPDHALAWLTPVALAGMGIGALAALLAAALPQRAAAALGLMVLSALLVLVAQAPADPYFAQSLQAWAQGRFIRFHGAAQWVGWLWPYAALVVLLARVSDAREA